MAEPSAVSAPKRRAGKAAKKNLTSAAIGDLSLWEQFTRVGGGITPSTVSSILRQADTGDTRRLDDLANEFRQKDCGLHSVLQTREIAVSGLPWELFFEGQAAKSTKGKRQRKFIETALRNCEEEFGRMLAHQMGAPLFGKAVSETICKKVDGFLVPVRFENHAPRRFRFDPQTGDLVWWDDVMGAGVNFREEWPDKFIVSQPRINGDIPCREGLARLLVWPALFRNWTTSDWLKLAEIAWKPWRLGQFDKSASKEDIDSLKLVLANMSSSGVAVHPETTKIELKWPDGAGGSSGRSDHAGLFDVFGREMAKAVLGQTLTSDQGSKGSHALGKVHNEIRKDILEADARYLAAVITKQLIEPLIRINFGARAPVPQFRFITSEAEDLEKFAIALDKLVGPTVKLPIPVEWALNRAGIPAARPGEALLGATSEPAPQPPTDSTPPTPEDPSEPSE